MVPIELSVVVAANGRPGDLRATLAALAGRSPGWELLVAGAGVAERPEVEAAGAILVEATGALPLRRHAAARQARGSFLAFVAAGLLPAPDWQAPALDLFRREPSTGIVGGRLVHRGLIEHAGLQVVGFKADQRIFDLRYLGQPADHAPAMRLRNYQAVSDACLFLRREDYRAWGGLDAGLGPSYAGADLCFKAQFQAGMDCVYHPGCLATWVEGSAPPRDAPVNLAQHQAFHQRWQGRWMVDYLLWDDVDRSEAKTGRAIRDFNRLL